MPDLPSADAFRELSFILMSGHDETSLDFQSKVNSNMIY